MKNKNNLVIASVVMVIFTILSKISGFLREIVLAYFYGASNITDAYISVSTISTALFSGITVAVATGYLTTMSKVPKEKVSKVTSNIINVSMLLIFVASIFVTIFIDDVIPLVSSGFTLEVREITASMARIILPFSFFYSISNILSGYLQFKNTFWTIGVSVVINNFVNIIAFALSGGNTNILAIGFVMSWVMPSVFFAVMAYRKGFKYKLSFAVKDEHLVTIAKLGAPIFLGQLVFQLNTIVDRNFASTIGEGTMTAMKYANQLNLFVTTLFVTSITTAIFPELSKLSANGEIGKFKEISKTTINTVMLFVLPITVAFMLLSGQIVEFVFMRGEFNYDDFIVTSRSLLVYSLAIPSISMNEILNKQFYALKDTKTPVFSSMISLSLNICLNFLLIERFSYMGLAFATALSNTVLAIVLYARLRKKIGNLGTKSFFVSGIKMAISSVIMGVFVYFLINFTENILVDSEFLSILQIIICALFGSILYFILVYFLKIPEVHIVLEFVKKKIKRKA